MKNFTTLWKREVYAALVSPTAYILATMFLVVMGMGFWSIASYRLQDGASVYDVLRGLYGGVAWFAVIMVIPVLTMRSFAEEKRTGTLETLLTAPVSEWEVVMGKFAGVCAVYALMWLPTLAYILALNVLNDQKIPIDPGAVGGAYAGGLLIGMFFLSIGILCSALSSNMVAASISTFAVLSLIFLAGFLPEVATHAAFRSLAGYFSPVLHMLEFARGVMDTRPVVLYLSSTTLVLFATVRVLETRRWKS